MSRIGQLGLVEDLVHGQRGERHLGGGDAPQVVALDVVGVVGELGQLAGGGERRASSTRLGGRISSKGSALRSSASWHSARGRVAPCPRNMVNIEPEILTRPLEVEDAELGRRSPSAAPAGARRSRRRRSPRRRSTGCPLAHPVGASAAGCWGCAAAGRGARREVLRPAVEHLLLLAQRLALELHRLGLVDLAVAAEEADLLRDRVDPGPDLVALGGQLSLALVELADPTREADGRVVAPAGDGRAHHVELGADALDVDHGRRL